MKEMVFILRAYTYYKIIPYILPIIPYINIIKRRNKVN